MATSDSKKQSKNLKALFSVICLSIIALGLIVYFSANSKDNSSVGEPTTVVETTEVQNRVEGVTDTTKATTSVSTTEKTTKAEKTTAEPSTMDQTDTNTPYKSFYKYPISEKVLSGYTEELVKNETMGDFRAHNAVDFKANKGAEVSSINDGLILDVKKDALLGNVITIDHGGTLIAKYCGMDVINVSKGDYVTIGQVLGTVGTVPFEAKSDSHLHFETMFNGESVNPLDVMSKTE